MWFLLTICGFVAAYMVLVDVLSRDDGPYGWIIRTIEIGIPGCAFAVLAVLSLRQNCPDPLLYQFAAAVFGIAAFESATRKIFAEHCGIVDETSTVMAYMILMAAGFLIVAFGIFGWSIR